MNLLLMNRRTSARSGNIVRSPRAFTPERGTPGLPLVRNRLPAWQMRTERGRTATRWYRAAITSFPRRVPRYAAASAGGRAEHGGVGPV